MLYNTGCYSFSLPLKSDILTPQACTNDLKRVHDTICPVCASHARALSASTVCTSTMRVFGEWDATNEMQQLLSWLYLECRWCKIGLGPGLSILYGLSLEDILTSSIHSDFASKWRDSCELTRFDGCVCVSFLICHLFPHNVPYILSWPSVRLFPHSPCPVVLPTESTCVRAPGIDLLGARHLQEGINHLTGLANLSL